MALSNSEKLQVLNYSGIRVGEDGHVTDWQERPARRGKPVGRHGDDPHVLRFPFTPQEDQELKEWCVAAEQEGVRGDRVYEQLEAVRPSHPWQAYRNRWRKTLRSTQLPDLSFDDAYPQLDKNDCAVESPDRLNDHNHSPPSGECQQNTGSTSTTYYTRCFDERQIHEGLGVCNDAELRRLLRETWVIKIYKDLRTAEAPSPATLDDQSEPKIPLAGAALRFKLEEALLVLNAPDVPPSIDTVQARVDCYSSVDPEVRFLTCAARFGSETGCIWDQEKQQRGWRGPCEAASWLLVWFQWLHEDNDERGKESPKIQQKREIWRTFVDGLTNVTHGHTMSSTHVEEFQQSLSCNDGANSSELLLRPEHSNVMQVSSRKAAKQQVDRQIFLISAQARNAYLSERDARLKAWGIRVGSQGSCVLVPAIWARTEPVSLLEHPDSWPVEEPGTPRLRLSMGSFTFLWARVAAWFEQWPRSTTDLQDFLPPNDCREDPSHMHGSHLCHHGLCINPTHIAYEDKARNLERAGCLSAAATLRSYRATIPKHCSRHDPPCLLQHAAITTFEAFSIQFNILQIAKGIGEETLYAQPEGHPPQYQTFERGPEPSQWFPDVGIRVVDIIHSYRKIDVEPLHGLHWTCPLCAYPRVFRRITSFWAHLRAGHQDTARATILQEVTRSAKVNKAWADQHSYNYKRDNHAMWQKLVQAQSEDFSWEDFQGWRFSRERVALAKTSSIPSKTV